MKILRLIIQVTVIWVLTAIAFAMCASALSGSAYGLTNKWRCSAYAVPSTQGKWRIATSCKHRHVRDTRAFPPSKAALIAQNEAIDELGLPRFRNDAEVQAAVRRGDLWGVMCHLPANECFLRPEAAGALLRLQYAYAMRFQKSLNVTSMLRTEKYQLRLRRWNHNAAPVHGPLRSSHLAGTTFDIGRKNMTRAETLWMEEYLYNLGDAVIVEEENGQACFHIFVRG